MALFASKATQNRVATVASSISILSSIKPSTTFEFVRCASGSPYAIVLPSVTHTIPWRFLISRNSNLNIKTFQKLLRRAKPLTRANTLPPPFILSSLHTVSACQDRHLHHRNVPLLTKPQHYNHCRPSCNLNHGRLSTSLSPRHHRNAHACCFSRERVLFLPRTNVLYPRMSATLR